MEPTSIKPDVTIMSDHVEASDVIAIKIEEAEPENAKLEIIGDNTEELSVTEPSSNNVAGNFCVASLSHEIVDDDVFEVEAEGTHDESDVVIGDAADEVVISTATAVATVVVAAAASVGDESPDLGKALTTNEGIEKEEVVEPAVGDVGEGSVAAEVVLVGATSTGTLIGDAESIVAREVLPDGAEDANIEMEIDEEFVSPAVVISSDDTYKGGEASPEVGHDEEFEINLDAGRIVAASLGDKDSAEFIACTGAVAASDSDALISPVETYKWVPLDPYSSRLIWMRRLVLLSGDSSPSPKPSKKRAAPARKWLSVDPSSTRLIWIRRVECTARTNSRHKAAVNARTWVPLDPSSSRPIWVRRSVVPVGQHRH
ncbi:hypothetical protein PHYBOEH_005847 [Phytophthora boehmeriae]|uniref:Uncharacterized protein n=1 Tax=Phytophthora boehmeriae TaxID=109152 RepID=A0A8T1WJI1_9STRA|nr:hypothetical protein PHYBOEH_005847 [Phytophthora boehmeriae]